MSSWATQTDAISARTDQALDKAIQVTVPTAKRVKLPGATLQNEGELDAWLGKVRVTIMETLKDGPATV